MRVKMKNKKKAVKLAPKDYVNTLIWFLGGFWVEIMLDGNFTYNLGADTCRYLYSNILLASISPKMSQTCWLRYTDGERDNQQ